MVGRHGSGTIFFSGCNLGCVFCQNHEISHGREGATVSVARLAQGMLYLQGLGCHNINWVTPTHQIPAIVAAWAMAKSKGLNLPTVYNCGGYEQVETLRLLEGIVDIYMPDAKFASAESARRYSAAPDYPEVLRAALGEMHRQVGDLTIRDGLAVKGLLVRHLVMPGMTDESVAVLDLIASDVSRNTFVNIMAQYRPAFRAHQHPAIARRITSAEHQLAEEHARGLGLRICA